MIFLFPPLQGFQQLGYKSFIIGVSFRTGLYNSLFFLSTVFFYNKPHLLLRKFSMLKGIPFLFFSQSIHILIETKGVFRTSTLSLVNSVKHSQICAELFCYALQIQWIYNLWKLRSNIRRYVKYGSKRKAVWDHRNNGKIVAKSYLLLYNGRPSGHRFLCAPDSGMTTHSPNFHLFFFYFWDQSWRTSNNTRGACLGISTMSPHCKACAINYADLQVQLYLFSLRASS